MSSEYLNFHDELVDIEKSVGIKEGIFGVIMVLSAIDRYPGISSYKLSRITSIPIPVCVAIRNELIKRGWCKKKNGSILTSAGIQIVRSLSKINRDFYCENCQGLGVKIPIEEYKKELQILKRYADLRGKPKTDIDQSFATPETSLRRVMFLIHRYDVFREKFVFIGDSDLTSIALALFTQDNQEIVVFDIDERVGEIINKANKELNKKIKFVKHNFRDPIPIEYSHSFHCAITDPPYTLQGVKLFISRAIQAIDLNYGGAIYLSFVQKPPKEMLNVQLTLLNMGCIITDIIPRFNTYVGAQKLAGHSTLFRLITTSNGVPIINGRYDKELYTGDINPTVRFYECTKCRHVFKIGKNEEYKTIEQLKETKCPFCNNGRFQKIKEERVQTIKKSNQ